MDATMSEVVQFIQENDVKFIRLAFCDIFGNQKNIAIMPTEPVSYTHLDVYKRQSSPRCIPSWPPASWTSASLSPALSSASTTR